MAAKRMAHPFAKGGVAGVSMGCTDEYGKGMSVGVFALEVDLAGEWVSLKFANEIMD